MNRSPHALFRVVPCLLIVALLGGCGNTYRVPEHCSWTGERVARETLPTEVTPEWGEMPSWRRFTVLEDVGPAVHHFAVFYKCIEPNLLNIEVTENADGTLNVLLAGGYWGGLAEPVAGKDGSDDVPDDLQHMADAIRNAVGVDGRDIQVAYRGHYRKVKVSEFVQTNDSGPEGAVGFHASMTLASSPDLKRLVAPNVVSATSGVSMLCAVSNMCFSSPHFVALEGSLLDGPIQDAAADGPAEDWTAAVLAAARQKEAGQSGPALAEMVVAPDRLLPPDTDQQVFLQSSLFGRTAPGEAQKSVTMKLETTAKTLLLADYPVTLRTRVAVDQTTFDVAATLTATAPIPMGHRGPLVRTFDVELVVSDGRGGTQSGRYQLSGEVMVEEGQAGTLGLNLVHGTAPQSGHPARFQFDGDATYTGFDVYWPTELRAFAPKVVVP